MSVFADSSALVKLYSDEAGHASVRSITQLVVSQVARVEVPSAIWRKQRLGELTPEQARILTEDFEADYFGTDSDPPRFVPVRMSGAVLDTAARMCAVHGLRAYDAIQLAAAVAARTAVPDCRRFAAFDDALRRAAAAEGFELVPGTA